MITPMGVAIALQNLLYATIGAKPHALSPVFAEDIVEVGEGSWGSGMARIRR